MFVFNQCGFKLHKSLVKRIKAADRAAAAEATLNCNKGGVLPGDEGDGRAIHYPLTLYKLSHTNAAHRTKPFTPLYMQRFSTISAVIIFQVVEMCFEFSAALASMDGV